MTEQQLANLPEAGKAERVEAIRGDCGSDGAGGAGECCPGPPTVGAGVSEDGEMDIVGCTFQCGEGRSRGRHAGSLDGTSGGLGPSHTVGLTLCCDFIEGEINYQRFLWHSKLDAS